MPPSRWIASACRRFSRSTPARIPLPVLLVEDDPTTREMTTQHSGDGKGGGSARRKTEVWRLESMEESAPTLILLDLMMPEMDGFEFVDRVRQHPEWRSIPIVVVTAKDLSDEDRRRLNGYVETILHKARRAHVSRCSIN